MCDTEFDVLMPVYFGDSLAVFSRAVDSVLKNTIQPKRFVIVLDGPVRPDVDDYLKALDQSEMCVFLCKLKDNVGLSNALNIGLKACCSELVFRCDADDINLTKRFIVQLKEFKNLKCDILGCQIEEIDPETNQVRLKNVPTGHNDIIRYAKYRNPINHMTVLFKRSAILKIGGYPSIQLKEDYALWLKALSMGLEVRNTDKVLVQARAGNSLVKRRKNSVSIKSEFKLYYFRLIKLNQPLLSTTFGLIIRTSILMLPKRFLLSVYSYLRKIDPSRES